MLNGQLFHKKLILMSVGIMIMATLASTARADDRITRSHTFTLDGIEAVEFSNGVGSIDIVPADGDEMRVVVDIEGKRHGFFRRSVDVEEMDLEIRRRGDTLFLSFEEKNVGAQWVVEMPAVARTGIQIGVGELRFEAGATAIDVEMGVGDIRIEAPGASVGRITASVGVGDVSLRGGEMIDRDSAFISQRIRAEGRGTHPLDVELGVGDINIRLK